jgi:ABC-2 type transport system permease protein
MSSFVAVLRKECIQMIRDRGMLGLALFIPVFELIMFGLIDSNVKHVPTAVFDQCRTFESRQLVEDFVNTSTFDVVETVGSREELRERIVAGRVSVGLEIPPDYARCRLAGRPANFLVLIDGSDSSVASQALAASSGLALSRSLEELSGNSGNVRLAVQPFPQLLFNPDSRSANLLIPGLIAILLTFSGTILAAFAIVKERERSTLEQLLVTPVSPIGLVLGKLLPYLALGFVQLLIVLTLMTGLFHVPIHGSVPLLLALSLLYLFVLLAIGLVISSRAKTQMEAVQAAQMFLLPSIFLSGYIFPMSSLPLALRYVAKVLPATHFIAITRGIVIRGATLHELWPSVLWLIGLSIALLALSARAFKKTIG